jgi:hypothetical protein
MSNDQQISDILAKYGEDFKSQTWVVPGGKARAIYHACLERIVAQAGITFDQPNIVSADPTNVVIIVTGQMGDAVTWSFGEASPKNNKNAYPYSMAEKRAKDRVALKLLRLHGLVYSEEEADDFKAARTASAPDLEKDAEVFSAENKSTKSTKSAYRARKDGDWEKCMESLKTAADKDIAAVLAWPTDQKEMLSALPWPSEAEEAWRVALASSLAGECEDAAHVMRFCEVYKQQISSLTGPYLQACREVVGDALRHYRGQKQEDRAFA